MIEENKIKQLPIGWKWTKLEEVCEIISGKNQSKVVNPKGKYPIYGSSGIFGYADEYLCKEGTTVIGRKGTINSPIFVNTKFWNVDTAFGLSPNLYYNNKLLYYFCKSFNFHKLDKSTTIPSLAKRDLLNIELPLPPLPTQHAIVAKIEELFSELDKGIENLRLAQQQLKTYRQSVLKWAFEGGGTSENVKDGELPEGWKNVKFKDVEEDKFPMSYGVLKPGDHIPDGIPLIQSQHIKGNVISSNINFNISKELDNQFKRTRIKGDEILITLVGASIGRCAIASKVQIGYNVSRAVAVLTVKKEFQVKYILYYLNNFLSDVRIKALSSGSAQPVLNLGTIRDIQINYPSSKEQLMVVEAIESRLSVADKMEESINHSLQKSDSLRQSILKKAFEGKLITN